MATNVLECGDCGAPLHPEAANGGTPTACPRCGAVMTLDIFPAAFRAESSQDDAGLIVDSDEASCFLHADRRATVSCGSCGKFLCDLCDVSLLGEHYCTSCLEAIRRKPDLGTRLHTEYRRWDILAMRLTWVSLFLPLAILSAPLALYFAVLAWRSPKGPVGSYRARAMLLIVVNTLIVGLYLGLLMVGIFGLVGAIE